MGKSIYKVSMVLVFLFFATFLAACSGGSNYNITATVNEGGKVVGVGQYKKDSLVKLTATADEGYIFSAWENGNNEVVSYNNPFSFVATENAALKALFMKDNTGFSLNVITKTQNRFLDLGGSVKTSYSLKVNATGLVKEKFASLLATPKEGFKFTGWEINSEIVSTSEKYDFLVAENLTVYAKFEAITNLDISEFYGKDFVNVFIDKNDSMILNRYSFKNENTFVVSKFESGVVGVKNDINEYVLIGNNLVVLDENLVVYTVVLDGVNLNLKLDGKVTTYKLVDKQTKLNGKFYHMDTAQNSFDRLVFSDDGTVDALSYKKNEELIDVTYNYFVTSDAIVMYSDSNLSTDPTIVYKFSVNKDLTVIKINQTTLYETKIDYLEDEVNFVAENEDYLAVCKMIFEANNKVAIFQSAYRIGENVVDQSLVLDYFISENKLVLIDLTRKFGSVSVVNFEFSSDKIVIDLPDAKNTYVVQNGFESVYYQAADNDVARYEFKNNGDVLIDLTYRRLGSVEFITESAVGKYVVYNNQILIYGEFNYSSVVKMEKGTFNSKTNEIVIDSQKLFTEKSYIEGAYYVVDKNDSGDGNIFARMLFSENGDLSFSYVEFDMENQNDVVEHREFKYIIFDNSVIVMIPLNVVDSEINTTSIKIISNNEIDLSGKKLVTASNKVNETYYLAETVGNERMVISMQFFENGTAKFNVDRIDDGKLNRQSNKGFYYILKEYVYIFTDVDGGGYGFGKINYNQQTKEIVYEDMKFHKELSYLSDTFYAANIDDESSAAIEIGFVSNGYGYSFATFNNSETGIEVNNFEFEYFVVGGNKLVMYKIVDNEKVDLFIIDIKIENDFIMLGDEKLIKNKSFLNDNYFEYAEFNNYDENNREYVSQVLGMATFTDNGRYNAKIYEYDTNTLSLSIQEDEFNYYILNDLIVFFKSVNKELVFFQVLPIEFLSNGDLVLNGTKVIKDTDISGKFEYVGVVDDENITITFNFNEGKCELVHKVSGQEDILIGDFYIVGNALVLIPNTNDKVEFVVIKITNLSNNGFEIHGMVFARV